MKSRARDYGELKKIFHSIIYRRHHILFQCMFAVLLLLFLFFVLNKVGKYLEKKKQMEKSIFNSEAIDERVRQ